MEIDTFIATALRRDGLDPKMAHNAGVVRGLRQGMRFLSMVGWSVERPNPCALLVLGCLVGGTGGMRWREYDIPRAPASKVPALMQLWCDRLPTWSPEQAFDAVMTVAPSGSTVPGWPCSSTSGSNAHGTIRLSRRTNSGPDEPEHAARGISLFEYNRSYATNSGALQDSPSASVSGI
jgi:hypothetical protein